MVSGPGKKQRLKGLQKYASGGWKASKAIVIGGWGKDGKCYEVAGSLAKLSPTVTLKLKLYPTN